MSLLFVDFRLITITLVVLIGFCTFSGIVGPSGILPPEYGQDPRYAFARKLSLKELSNDELRGYMNLKPDDRYGVLESFYPHGYSLRSGGRDPFDIEAEKRGFTLYKRRNGTYIFHRP